MKKVMKKSTVRQRKTEVLLLLFSLVALSIVYVRLLSSSYSTYLKEQDEHKLTYEGHSSIPSVSSSSDNTSSADGEISGDVSGASASGDVSSVTGTDEGSAASASGDVSDSAGSSPAGSTAGDAGQDSADFTDESSATMIYERTPSGHAILLGDADMLSIYSYDPTNATVCTTSGISAANVLASTFIVPEVSNRERTVEQILNLGDYDTCYLFLGVHETEWYYEDSFIEYYEALIAEIQELAPDTVIYIHAIPSVSALAEAGVSTAATDEHIAELNVRLKALAGEFHEVVYIEL